MTPLIDLQIYPVSSPNLIQVKEQAEYRNSLVTNDEHACYLVQSDSFIAAEY